QLVEPGADLLGHRRRTPLLDAADDFQEIGASDVVDRPLAQRRQDVLVEGTWDLREGGLPPLLEPALLAELVPLLIDRLEGVLFGLGSVPTVLLALSQRIDALGHERASAIAAGARLAHADLRIGPQGHPLLPTEPVVAEVPRPGAGRGDGQGEAI